MAGSKRARSDDAFSRISGMPPAYFAKSHARYPNGDMSALRVFLALRTAARRVDNVVGSWLDRHNMTVTKLDVLHLLASAETGTTIGELREFLKMTQPNVTFVMRNLERDGLVRRLSDPGDRRIWIFFITKAGLDLIDELSPAHLDAIGAAVRGLSEAERVRLIESLVTVAEGFEAAESP